MLLCQDKVQHFISTDSSPQGLRMTVERCSSAVILPSSACPDISSGKVLKGKEMVKEMPNGSAGTGVE